MSIDSKLFGLFYLPVIGAPSIISAMGASSGTSPEGYNRSSHSSFWTETRANRNASSYFGVHYKVSWTSDQISFMRSGTMYYQSFIDAFPL